MPSHRISGLRRIAIRIFIALLLVSIEINHPALARTQKPVLHARHWLAITGKPLAATAGARIFQQGGNAVDAACAMLAATSNVQQASEAPNVWSYQMMNSFDDHGSQPGRLVLNDVTPPYVREALREKGYTLEFRDRTSGPINAIYFDREHGTMWGGSSNYGDDYGVGW